MRILDIVVPEFARSGLASQLAVGVLTVSRFARTRSDSVTGESIHVAKTHRAKEPYR